MFNVCDEFIIHAHKSHLLVAIITHLHIDSRTVAIGPEPTLQWLESTAQSIFTNVLHPVKSTDTTVGLHWAFYILRFYN